jgi:hypothetical protein
LNLITEDASKFPLGVDKEKGEDEAEVEGVGHTALASARREYSSAAMRALGEKDAVRVTKELNLGLPTPPKRPSQKELSAFSQQLEASIGDVEQTLADLRIEIQGVADFMFTVQKQCAQAQRWNRIYKDYMTALVAHLEGRSNEQLPVVPSPGGSPARVISFARKNTT